MKWFTQDSRLPGEADGRSARATLQQRLLGLLTLAEAATGDERVDLLRQAVETGMQLWAPELAGEKPVAWGAEAAHQPFLQAVMAYGRALATVSQHTKAALCFKALLALAPDDALGAQAELHKLPFWTDGDSVKADLRLVGGATAPN